MKLLRTFAAPIALLAAAAIAGEGCQGEHAAPDAGAAHSASALAGSARGAAPNFDGRVRGAVTVQVGAQSFPLAGAQVYLVDATGRRNEQAERTTDVRGLYEIPPQPLGQYTVCAEHAGLTTSCSSEPLVVTASSPYAVRDFTLTAGARAIAGQVLLADGSPCYHTSVVTGVTTAAHVAFKPAGQGNDQGNGSGGPFAADAGIGGRYFVPMLPRAGDYVVTVQCGAATTAQTLTISAAQLGGGSPVDIHLADTPPRIRALFAVDAGGTTIRSAAPGATVGVQAQAIDVDGDALTYAWKPVGAKPLAATGASIAWTLPAVSQRNAIVVEVSDGRGGFATQTLTLAAAGNEGRFLGHVRDETGQPVVGATVSVNGVTALTGTQGGFRVLAPASARYTVTASKTGYAPTSQVYGFGQGGLDLHLQHATESTLDPTARNDVHDRTNRAVVKLLPNTLVDAGGNGPAGALTVAVTAYDPRRPQDMPGVELNGAAPAQPPSRARPSVAMAVDIHDASGTPFNLAPGQTATILLPVPPAQAASPPATQPLFHYDESQGRWLAEGQATLVAGHYEAPVSHFSVWSLGDSDSAYSDPTDPTGDLCMQIGIPAQYVGQVGVRVKQQQDWNEDVVLGQFVPDDVYNELQHINWHLGDLTVDVFPVDSPSTVLATIPVQYEGQYAPPIDYPYIKCGLIADGSDTGWWSAVNYLPGTDWLTIFQGSESSSQQYYDLIGATTTRATFTQWLQANGFTAADKANEVNFFNHQEFGLGRQANCKQTGSDPTTATVACYVTKYGQFDGAPEDALDDAVNHSAPDDTVALEFSPGPGGTRILKAFAYKPDGTLSTTTAFDPSGDRFVPEVCMHCHAKNGDWASNKGDFGGKFVFFDVASAYDYVDTPGSPYTLDAQQERFRQFNQMVELVDGPGVYTDFIDSLYPGGVGNVGSQANVAPTLPGWAGLGASFQDAVKPDCRTCHIWQSSFSDLSSLQPSLGGMVHDRICQGIMPQARQPMKNLWHSLVPFQGDEILSAYGQPSCFGNGPGPTVTITAPTNGQQLPAGQFFQVSATATDPSDGTKDEVVWTDGNGVTLGYGRQLLIVAQAGPQTLFASTIDSRYRVARTSVSYTGTDQPPTANIVSPTPTDSVYVGIPFLFQGQASDPNELLGLPCSSLVWTSSVPSDPFPATGCYPAVTFTTPGSRTITLTATDPQGQFGTAQLALVVSAQPTSGPPIVSILSPHPTDFLAPNAQVTLHGFIVDPQGTGPLSYQWLLEDNTETVLGSGSSATPSLDVQTPWTPTPSVTTSCGPKTVTIRLSATGPGGTTVQSVTFQVNFPTC